MKATQSKSPFVLRIVFTFAVTFFAAGAHAADEGIARVATAPVDAAPTADAEPALTLEALDSRQRILERKWELQQEEAAQRAGKAGVAEASAKGFRLSSADGKSELRFRFIGQADGNFFLNDDNPPAYPNQFLLRRVRPMLQGQLPGNVEFRLQTDFGQGKVQLLDAYAEINPSTYFGVRAGKFKGPVGLERLQSPQDLILPERGYPTSLVPNRDVGAQVHGNFGEGILTYAVGIFNGSLDGSSNDGDTSDEKDLDARLFGEPLKETGVELIEKLGFGIAGTLGNQQGAYFQKKDFAPVSNLPSYKSPGGATFFSYRSDPSSFAKTVVADGTQRRLVPQGYYYYRSLGLIGEYAVSEQRVKRKGQGAALQHRAYTVSVGYLLTGEDASSKAVVPARPISDGGWGAWQVAGRYGALIADKESFPFYADAAKSARAARSWSAGLNWYATANYRVLAAFEKTKFEEVANTPKAAQRQDENLVTTRVQVVF